MPWWELSWESYRELSYYSALICVIATFGLATRFGYLAYCGWAQRRRAIKQFERGIKSGVYPIPREDDDSIC